MGRLMLSFFVPATGMWGNGTATEAWAPASIIRVQFTSAEVRAHFQERSLFQEISTEMARPIFSFFVPATDTLGNGTATEAWAQASIIRVQYTSAVAPVHSRVRSLLQEISTEMARPMFSFFVPATGTWGSGTATEAWAPASIIRVQFTSAVVRVHSREGG